MPLTLLTVSALMRCEMALNTAADLRGLLDELDSGGGEDEEEDEDDEGGDDEVDMTDDDRV